MPIRFAIRNGNWSSGSTWDGFAQLGFPNGEDDVFANSYTIAMDTSVDVRSLNNSQTPRVVENIATPAMTSNATPSGFVYASGFVAGSDPWRAFDQNTSTTWFCNTTNTGTLTYEFPTARNIKRYAFRNQSFAPSVPRQWRLEGSNDNIAFTVLETVTASLAVNSVYTSAILANTASFTFYRINISAVTTAGNQPAIAELELTESTGSGAGNLSGGSFNFNTPNVSASILSSVSAGATNLIQITATTGTVNINAPNVVFTGINASSTQIINYSGNCNLIITGSSFIGGQAGQFASCINKTSAGILQLIGNLFGRSDNNGIVGPALLSTNGNNFIVGNVIAGTTAINGQRSVAIEQTAGALTVLGNITGGALTTNNNGILFSGTSLTITGSITGGTGATAGAAISISSTPTVNISGSINAATAVGISSVTANTTNIIGNVNGSANAAGISYTGAATLTVRGTVTAGTGQPAIVSTSTSATNRLTGPFISSTTGIQPFYGPKLTIITGSATYWTFTTSDSLSTKTLFSPDLVTGLPVTSDVRQGITYASGTLTGTMIVPPTESVAFGVPVDDTSGSAVIIGPNYNISNEIWNTHVANLTGSATIGERLKNVATIASTGAQIAAMAGGN